MNAQASNGLGFLGEQQSYIMQLSKVNFPVSEFQELEEPVNNMEDSLLHSFFDKCENYSIEDDQVIKGMVQISHDYERPEEPNVHISTMYVLKRYRNQATGKKALDLIKQKYDGQLITCCPFSEDSARFFIHEGFVPEGDDPDMYYYLYFKA